jgi:hypothetical protein
MPSSGLLHCVALVRIDVSEDRIVSIIRVTRTGELGATLAVTRIQSTLQLASIDSCCYCRSYLADSSHPDYG